MLYVIDCLHCSVVVNADNGVNTPDIDVSMYARIGLDATVGLPNLGSGGYYYGRDLIPTTAQPPLQLTPVSYPITDTYPPLLASYPGHVAASLTQSIPTYTGLSSHSSESERQPSGIVQPVVIDARLSQSIKSTHGKMKQRISG